MIESDRRSQPRLSRLSLIIFTGRVRVGYTRWREALHQLARASLAHFHREWAPQFARQLRTNKDHKKARCYCGEAASNRVEVASCERRGIRGVLVNY